MDDQSQCLLSAHHFTYLGVCYEGTDFYINITNPAGNTPATGYVGHAVSTPEPGVPVLLAMGLAVLAVRLWRYRVKA